MLPNRNGHLRIVVADDSDLVRRHVVSMLSAIARVEVVEEAEDMARTLYAVRTLQPEVVVLDIQLPDGNGLIALQHIKREFPETQVIMLTNHVDPFYRARCLEAGASFFFDKTREFDRVGEVVRSLAS